MLFSYGQDFPETPPVANLIDQAAELYLGVRDQEIMVLTHNCLLLGCLLLYSAIDRNTYGLLVAWWKYGFGLGDAAASCVGFF